MSHPQKAFYSKFLSSLNKLLTIVFLFVTLILNVICHILNYTCEQKSFFPLTIENIVVVGFKPAVSEEERPSLFRCPICGATFMAESVSDDLADCFSV